MMRSMLERGRRGRPSVGLLAVGVAACVATTLGAVVPAQSPGFVRVLIETELGEIEIELEAEKAPLTTANFLRYLDAGFFDDGLFHRSARLDNQVRDDVLIEVIQGGPNRERTRRPFPPGELDRTPRRGFPPIELERTRDTGLKHLDGTISMARGGPDSATSGFFICIGEQPSLDFGGDRNADGQGFAAFGRVVRGMDVVRRIHASPTGRGENLAPPILIVKASRIE